MTATAIEPLTPEWHEARRHGIGASEIAAVLGISPWESPLSLYWRKREGWEVEETEQMRTGRILEPAIAEWAAGALDCDATGRVLVPCSLMAHPDRPWQLATPDRILRQGVPCGPCDYGVMAECRCGETEPIAVVELKWTSTWDGWGDDGTDDIPVHYRAQVLWQCDVVGVGEWYLAALGPGGFRLYSGRQDPGDLAVMVEAGRRFVERLERGDPPPIDDHHATVAALRRLHPDLDDVEATVPDQIAAGYLRAVRMARLAERVKQRYEAELRAAMGSAHRAVTADGRRVATRVITDIPEQTITRAAHRRDYLLPPRERKTS